MKLTEFSHLELIFNLQILMKNDNMFRQSLGKSSSAGGAFHHGQSSQGSGDHKYVLKTSWQVAQVCLSWSTVSLMFLGDRSAIELKLLFTICMNNIYIIHIISHYSSRYSIKYLLTCLVKFACHVVRGFS